MPASPAVRTSMFVLACAVLAMSAAAQSPVGTAVAYQGQLTQVGSGVDGPTDMVFTLWDADVAGNQIGPPLMFDGQGGNPPPIVVSNGLFTVWLDFGGGVFTGDARWLEISVRAPSGGGPYTTLSPRQELTPAPNAIYAAYASSAGAVPGGITGGGTAGYLAKFTGGGTLGDSAIFETASGTGIGTTSPLGRLHVQNDTGPALALRYAGNPPAAYSTLSDWMDNLAIQKLNSGNAIIDIDPLPTAGNVASVRFFRSTNTAGAKGVYFCRGNGALEIDSQIGIGGGTTFFNRYGGNVGIGTASPALALHVVATGGARIRVESPDHQAGIGFLSDSVGEAVVYSADGSDDLRFFVGGADRATIDANGHVGIGMAPHATPQLAVTGVSEGVYGKASAASGTTSGGFFTAASTAGRGIYAEATAASGSTVAGLFDAASPDGTGVRAYGGTYGVDAVSERTTGNTYAGWFSAASSDGTGVYGQATASGSGTKYGVHGYASGSGVTYGVYGEAAGTGPGTAVGIYGKASGPGYVYAGIFEGSVSVHENHYVGGGVSIGAAGTPNARLDLREDGAPSEGVTVNLERTTDFGAGQDLLQLRATATSPTGMQFIECERGDGMDIEFRVWGDGDVTADGTFTSPADFAEMIRVTTGADSVEPGDVLVIDPHNPRAVVKSAVPRSTLVVGVHSTKPGVLGSEHDWDTVARDLGLTDGGDQPAAGGSLKPIALGRLINEVPLAIVGIVPCKVSAENGPIRPGDLLVTSCTPGHAMRDEIPRPGTIVGKALEPLDAGTASIRVLVTLQ